MSLNHCSSLLVFLLLLSSTFSMYISRTEQQSVESVIAYRMLVKKNNQNYIHTSNSKNIAYELQPYPWLVSLTVEQYSLMYANRVMMQQHQLMAASVQKPNLSVDQVYIRKVGIKAVNNSLWTGKVKNQGACGSCYAFAATSLINYATSSEINGITSLLSSEQEIVECSFRFRNYGCNGGWPHQALLYARQLDISSDISYPYRFQTFNHSQLQNCSAIGKSNKQFKLKSYIVQVVSNASPLRMMNMIDKHGALAVGIVSSNLKFMFYKKGILDNCGEDSNNMPIDHAVTIQGYYSDPQLLMEYWIIKNSWGRTWGQYGRMRLRTNNNCKVGGLVCHLTKKN